MKRNKKHLNEKRYRRLCKEYDERSKYLDTVNGFCGYYKVIDELWTYKHYRGADVKYHTNAYNPGSWKGIRYLMLRSRKSYNRLLVRKFRHMEVEDILDTEYSFKTYYIDAWYYD